MTAILPTAEEPAVADQPLVLPFSDPRCRMVELTGGKGASLATMTAEGLPVPPGFVVTSAAFAAAVDTGATALDMPLILLGGINRLDTMRQAMREGFGFVAMARALLREPDLIDRMQIGRIGDRHEEPRD